MSSQKYTCCDSCHYRNIHTVIAVIVKYILSNRCQQWNIIIIITSGNFSSWVQKSFKTIASCPSFRRRNCCPERRRDLPKVMQQTHGGGGNRMQISVPLAWTLCHILSKSLCMWKKGIFFHNGTWGSLEAGRTGSAPSRIKAHFPWREITEQFTTNHLSDKLASFYFPADHSLLRFICYLKWFDRLFCLTFFIIIIFIKSVEMLWFFFSWCFNRVLICNRSEKFHNLNTGFLTG